MTATNNRAPRAGGGGGCRGQDKGGKGSHEKGVARPPLPSPPASWLSSRDRAWGLLCAPERLQSGAPPRSAPPPMAPPPEKAPPTLRRGLGFPRSRARSWDPGTRSRAALPGPPRPLGAPCTGRRALGARCESAHPGSSCSSGAGGRAGPLSPTGASVPPAGHTLRESAQAARCASAAPPQVARGLRPQTAALSCWSAFLGPRWTSHLPALGPVPRL